MSGLRVLILTGYGINCEEELAAAYRLAGAEPDLVHFGRLLSETINLTPYRIVNLPGGFAFGDELGAGKVLANRIRARTDASGMTLLEHLVRFVESGGYAVGICNGFQVLVNLGLLPNVGGAYEQEVSLAANLSGRFEDRWCRVAPAPNAPMAELAELGELELPVRHGEGRLVFRDEHVRTAVAEEALNVLTYVSPDGRTAEDYPSNPNGSELACAALSDRTGRVFGMMPHPEAHLSFYNHPDWARKRRMIASVSEEGDGLRFFRALIAAAAAS